LSEPLQIEPAVARGRLKEEMWNDPNWMVEEKLDGCRYLFHNHGDHFHLTSRRISTKTGLYVDKAANFPHLLELTKACLPGTVIDGELITSNRKAYDTVSISGSLPERAIWMQEQMGWAKFVAFDLPLLDSHLQTRKDVLWGIFNETTLSHCKLVPSHHDWRDEGRRKFLDQILEGGGEGVILKNLRSNYGDPRAWVKVKPVETYDVYIVGYIPAEEWSRKADGRISRTKYSEKGWIGAIAFSFEKEGAVVGCCSGMDEETREYLSSHQDENLGRMIEVYAQEKLPSGALRHPRFIRFRDDK
jgi:ATP-dependent DNA ligase